MSGISTVDCVNTDLRDPCSAMMFDNGRNGPVTNIQCGDKYYVTVTQASITRASS